MPPLLVLVLVLVRDLFDVGGCVVMVLAPVLPFVFVLVVAGREEEE